MSEDKTQRATSDNQTAADKPSEAQGPVKVSDTLSEKHAAVQEKVKAALQDADGNGRLDIQDKLITVIRSSFNLREDRASNSEIRERILSGGQLHGTNMFILVFAIFIASVGLNMNSTAVIIGAMLISPLMGSIMNMALGLAELDLAHFRNATVRFLFQIAVSLITSTVYFLLSPLHTASSELLARTQPTAWDVLIAIFGGLAGIIATTRKDRVSNVIPGVAIATALMPPLCTAGYGLATQQWKFFGGALYLFFINTFFICLTSFIILRALHISRRKFTNNKAARRVKAWVAIIAVVTVVPSILLGYQIVQESVQQSEYSQFVENEFNFENTQVVTSSLDTENDKIRVALIGTALTEEEIASAQAHLADYSLGDFTLFISQTPVQNGVTQDQLDEILKESQASDDEESQQLAALQQQLDKANENLQISSQADSEMDNIIRNVLVLFPRMQAFGFTDLYAGDSETRGYAAVAFMAPGDELSDAEQTQLYNYVSAQMGYGNIVVVQTTQTLQPDDTSMLLNTGTANSEDTDANSEAAASVSQAAA